MKNLSFEVFPPKGNIVFEEVMKPLAELAELSPESISVTCGAGGSKSSALPTVKISDFIQNKLKIPTCAHITCVNSTKSDVDEVLNELEKRGIMNLLALRGDMVEGVEPKDDFPHAVDLIRYIREKHGNKFSIAAACYPECHIKEPSFNADIKFLAEKVESGVDQLVTQLFFDNDIFYDFIDKIRSKNIFVPVKAGIMPVSGVRQIKRMTNLCGAGIPRRLLHILSKYEHDAESLVKAGRAYSINQIADLSSSGFFTRTKNGIHLYTMNKPETARVISNAVKDIL